jgi:hypothetical protein
MSAIKIKTFLFEKKFLRISNFEWLVILLFFSLLFVTLYKVAGGPIYSDEFYYMNLSINGTKSYLVLNYYFHIYFQKIFLLLAGSALRGARLFWVFLFTTTSLFIYLATRWMSRGKSFFNAILSVAIFLSIASFAKFSGMPKIDFTTMWIVTLIFTTAIFYYEFKINKKVILLILGFLFFLALKTKETALISSIVIFGFGIDEKLKFSFRELLKSFIFLFPGIVLGGLLFILLNWLIVHDPLWGIRLQDYITYFKVTVEGHRLITLDQNWISDFIFQVIPLPFLLYFWGGFKRLQSKDALFYRFLWLYPMVMLIFLICLMLMAYGYKIVERNYFPALPVICIFAAQVFSVNGKNWFRSIKWDLVFAGVGFILAIFFQQLIMRTYPITEWEYFDFIQNILLPIIIALLVIDLVIKEGRLVKTSFLSVVCISLGISSSLIANFQSIYIDRYYRSISSLMFYPFNAFKTQIHFSPQMTFFISPNLYSQQQMLAKTQEEIFSMFNIVFNTNATRTNFIYPAEFSIATGFLHTADPIQSLVEMNYDRALVTMNDWQQLQADHQSYQAVLSRYAYFVDAKETIVFLSRK